MKAILTRSVVRFLILQGYKYCLSKTTNIHHHDASVCITLTPIKFKPAITYLHRGYDTYFNIMREPLQLAGGVDDTEVLVNIDDTELQKFKGSISIL
jgi:hypothetical protein